MEPTLVHLPEPVQPTGNWLIRSWDALVHHRRLPTRLSIWLERLWIRFGRPTRPMQAGEARLRVRRLASDEHFVREVLFERVYNPPGFEIASTDVVIDVGGNIGAFAVLAGQSAPQGRVISIEPVEDNFQMLCENLLQNGLSDHVLPLKAAVVGRAVEQVTVFLNPIGEGNHSTLAELVEEPARTEQVAAVRLEDLFQQYQFARCDFLKLDCEGTEFEIIENLTPALAKRIARIAMEYHVPPGQDKRAEAHRLIERLKKLGFCIEYYSDVVDTTYGMLFARRLG